MPILGWILDRKERDELLKRFPPEWPDVVADHITLESHAGKNDPMPQAERAEIVGAIDDGEGLQAMVVAIDGSTDRPDGSTYHITWSLDRKRGRKPVQSNEVIAERGWHPLDDPVPVKIKPARW